MCVAKLFSICLQVKPHRKKPLRVHRAEHKTTLAWPNALSVHQNTPRCIRAQRESQNAAQKQSTDSWSISSSFTVELRVSGHHNTVPTHNYQSLRSAAQLPCTILHESNIPVVYACAVPVWTWAQRSVVSFLYILASILVVMDRCSHMRTTTTTDYTSKLVFTSNFFSVQHRLVALRLLDRNALWNSWNHRHCLE